MPASRSLHAAFALARQSCSPARESPPSMRLEPSVVPRVELDMPNSMSALYQVGLPRKLTSCRVPAPFWAEKAPTKPTPGWKSMVWPAGTVKLGKGDLPEPKAVPGLSELPWIW